MSFAAVVGSRLDRIDDWLFVKRLQFHDFVVETSDPVFRTPAQMRDPRFYNDPYRMSAVVLPSDNNPPMEHQFGLLIASIFGAIALGLAIVLAAGFGGHFLFG